MKNEKFYGYIYVTLNQQTKKVYVGQKSGLPEDSINYLGSGKRLESSIKHHGKQFFKKRVLGILESETKEELKILLDEAETECIYFYKSYGNNETNCDEIYGYNLTKGGGGALGIVGGMNGRTQSTESRKKISITRIKNKTGAGEKNVRFVEVNERIKKEIVEDYLSGNIGIKEGLPKKYKLGYAVIKRILIENNVYSLVYQKRVAMKIQISIIDDYKNGTYLEDIHKKHGVSWEVIHRILKDNNIPKRKKTYKKGKNMKKRIKTPEQLQKVLDNNL